MTLDEHGVPAVADEFMKALERCDVDAARSVYRDDAKIWHNFDQDYQSVEENLKMLVWLHETLRDVKYEIVRREPIPGGYYQQHVLQGTLASGESFSMPACAIVKIKDGRIASLDEYLDSRHTRPLQSR